MTWTGECIKQFRKAIGFTCEDLAHALNISVSTVARWEQGVGKRLSLT